VNSYLELVKFEYKKILRKRSTIITLIFGIFLTAFSCAGPLMGDYYINGKVFESKYDNMEKNREYARKLSNREINGSILSEAIEAYSHIPPTDGDYEHTDEYQQYARPYEEIYAIIRRVYDIDGRKELPSITQEKINDFYTVRQDLIESKIENTSMSSKEKANSINISKNVKTPFVFSYTGGYTRFYSLMQTTALIICMICFICISPIFAGEYTDRTDSLIFSSKYGRNKVICAKLFTGITFTIVLSIVLIITSYIASMVLFGWDGGKAPIQLYWPLSIVPFTIGKVAFLYSILILVANIFSSTLTIVLSSKLKSPFIVFAVMTVFTIIPMFLSVSPDVLWIYHLINLIPVKMLNISNIINNLSINLFGIMVQPYEFIIVFALAASIILLPVAYRNFRNAN